jgi:hypothetical protein
MTCDRDTIPNCINRHYDLLIRATYLGTDDVERPPPSGGDNPQLTVDLLRVFSRSERVISLLRYLPYLCPLSHPNRYKVYTETGYQLSARQDAVRLNQVGEMEGYDVE